MSPRRASKNVVAASAALLLLFLSIYALPLAKSLRFRSVSTEILKTSAESEIVQFLKIYEGRNAPLPFPHSADAAGWRKYQQAIYEWENSFLWHDGTNGAAVLHRTGLLLPVTASLSKIRRSDTWSHPALTATLVWSDGRCVEGSVQVPPDNCTEPFRQNRSAAVIVEYEQVGGTWHVWRLTQDPAWQTGNFEGSLTFWTMPRTERRPQGDEYPYVVNHG